MGSAERSCAPTLLSSMTAWNDARFRRHDIRRNTWRAAGWHIRTFTEVVGADTPVAQVTEEDIETWKELAIDSISPRSVNVVLGTIRGFFDHARRRELIEKDPSLNVRNVKVRKTQPRRLTRQQVTAVIELAPLQARTMVKVLAHLGVRRSELAGLSWEDLDWETMTLHVHEGAKGEKDRALPVEGEAASALREWHAHLSADRPLALGPLVAGPMWPSKQGGGLSSGSVARIVIAASEDAGMHITPHAYRRTNAITMHLDGAPADVIRRHLGHASLETTGHYLDATVEDIRPYVARTSYSNGRWRQAEHPGDGAA